MASDIRSNIASLPAIKAVLLAAFVGAFPIVSHAANNCPWINAATASGLLGADAVASYTDSVSTQPAVCTFTQSTLAITRVLRIAVIETPNFRSLLDKESTSCATAREPLRAIGNEAISCALDHGKKLYAERIVGRVRNQVFTITLSTNRRDDAILTQEERKARVLTAAEQVSGSLF